MNLSLVLIIYRSNSLTAKEASIFCNKALKDRNIKSKRIESDFDNNQLESYFYNLATLPELVIVLGGDGTVLKSANALVNYDIPIFESLVTKYRCFFSPWAVRTINNKHQWKFHLMLFTILIN